MKLFNKMGGKQTPLSQAEQNIRQAEYQIEQSYLELGRIVYQRSMEGNINLIRLGEEIPEFNRYMNKISQDRANRESYYRNYLQLQGLMECVNCNTQIPYGSVFCCKCGCKAAQIDSAYQSMAVTCKNCGEKLTKDKEFCTSCGNKLQD